MSQSQSSLLKRQFHVTCYGLILLLCYALGASSAELRVAVASNFYPTIMTLKSEFKAQTGHDLRISSASSGQLYAQIKNGAPYDVFMSADVGRPEQLVVDGLASELSIYARGQLVLLANLGDQHCAGIFQSDVRHFVALANPDLAPFGAAAKHYLQQQGVWNNPHYQVVMGENVSQAMQMVVSKNAAMGLVAKSLLVNYALPNHQCLFNIPAHQYPTIEQAMVFIKASDSRTVFAEWLNFLNSDTGRKIIGEQGYLLSETKP